MRKIITVENPILRQRAQEIELDAITTPAIQEVIADMKELLAEERFGVAIAAPQIGESLRIFVVGGKVFASVAKEAYDENVHLDQVFINPEVLKVSKKKKIGDEGCLSVPGKYGPKVERYDKITISYYDETGEQHERGAGSFLSRVFQHEIDHLNGILYIDHALKVIDVDEDLNPIN